MVFSSGMLAVRPAPRIGLDRASRIGLWLALLGGCSVLAVSFFNCNVIAFIIPDRVFLLGIGIVNPLGTAKRCRRSARMQVRHLHS